MTPVPPEQPSSEPKAPAGNFSSSLRLAFVALAMATVLCVEFKWGGPLRDLLVLAFLCIVPGAAVVSWGPRLDGLSAAALTLACSLSVSATIAMIAVWLRQYDPELMFLFTAGGSIVLLFAGPRMSSSSLSAHGRHYRPDDPAEDEEE